MTVPLPKDTVEAFAALAAARKLTIATVESCTAGAIAYARSTVQGSGTVLHGGFVVYSKPQKIALGVPDDLLARHSAESIPVAESMAHAALAHTPADLTLAVTGIAGPEPDEDGNPVGLVYVAAARRNGGAAVQRDHFDGNHQAICLSAIKAVLQLTKGVIVA